MIQELRPTLQELGISTPEELGIDQVWFLKAANKQVGSLLFNRYF